MKILAIAISLFVLLGSFDLSAQSRRSGTAAKKIYCYNDENGRRVCSDSLPAQEIEKARTEINSRTGIVTREVDRALTKEEIELIERQEEMALRREKQEAEELRKVELLVGNYHSEEDISRNYDAKIEQFNAQIRFSENAISQVRKTLSSQLKRLSDIELSNNKPPQNRIDEMMNTKKVIEDHRENIDRMKKSKLKAEQEKQLAIVTFRQYKNL